MNFFLFFWGGGGGGGGGGNTGGMCYYTSYWGVVPQIKIDPLRLILTQSEGLKSLFVKHMSLAPYRQHISMSPTSLLNL